MKIKHATQRLAEIKAHNARIATIRTKSLSNEAVDSIDSMIERADGIYEEIMECLYNGAEPNFTTSELVDFKTAIEGLRKQFTGIAASEYLFERAREEATWDDE